MERCLIRVHHLLRHARLSSKVSHGVRVRNITNSSDSQYRLRGASRLTPTTFVVGIIPVLTFALGTWQVKRLRWKLDLIQKLEDQVHLPPVELPDSIDVDFLSEFTYRRFLLSGKWDHTRSILVGPRTRDGVNGYNVITPLLREDGSTILVDRGFVSKVSVVSTRDLRRSEPQGEVEVLGMIRPPMKKTLFTPNNNPENGEWYWIDIEALKKWAGGDKRGVQSIVIEELFDGHSGEAANLIHRGIPVGRCGEIEMHNTHAVYALTWYSLSVATSIMFVRLLRRPHPFTSRLRAR